MPHAVARAHSRAARNRLTIVVSVHPFTKRISMRLWLGDCNPESGRVCPVPDEPVPGPVRRRRRDGRVVPGMGVEATRARGPSDFRAGQVVALSHAKLQRSAPVADRTATTPETGM